MDVVLNFVKDNFDLEYWDVESSKILPRALMLTSKNTGGTVLIWKDLNSDAVYFSINGEKPIKRYLLSLNRIKKKS